MKKTMFGIFLATALLSVFCGISKKENGESIPVETGKGKALAAQVKEAIENAGPFKVDVKVLKNDDEYDIKVSFKTASRTDGDWNSLSTEEKYGYFMGVCAGAVGIIAVQSGEDFEFGNLLIDYKNELWKIPVNYCSYLASASISGTMSDEEIGTKLLDKLEKVR